MYTRSPQREVGVLKEDSESIIETGPCVSGPYPWELVPLGLQSPLMDRKTGTLSLDTPHKKGQGVFGRSSRLGATGDVIGRAIVSGTTERRENQKTKGDEGR